LDATNAKGEKLDERPEYEVFS